MERIVVLSTQEGDWEALYVDGELIDQHHTLERIERNFLMKMGKTYGFDADDIKYSELNDEDDEYTADSGCLPNFLTDLKGTYNEGD